MIGCPPWSRADILQRIDEFSSIYADRPIGDNYAGMKAPHMFAVWFMAKSLQPDLIVESGIWKGQSTWLLEVACPQAKLISIDLELDAREYISDKAIYSDRDFSEQDWSEITDRSLVFFDDHQNAYRRLQQCKWFGIKHAIFEDNYPASQGDFYSLKKAFSSAGFDPVAPTAGSARALLDRLAGRFGRSLLDLSGQYETIRVSPNVIDARMLEAHLETYFEFPPVIKPERTRWGDLWDDSYPTPEPLLKRPEKPSHRPFLEEAKWYTWICYVKLK